MFRLLFSLIRIVFLVLLTLVALFVFRNAGARYLVQGVASSVVGLPFQLQKVEFISYVPLVLQGTGFVWENPPDFAERRALSGRSLQLVLGSQLWTEGTFRVEKLHLEIDELIVAISPSGESNLSRVSSLGDKPEEASWLARHLVIGETSFSLQRVLIYDFRNTPNPQPVAYRSPFLRESLGKNQTAAALTRSITERILSRTPLRLEPLLRSRSH